MSARPHTPGPPMLAVVVLLLAATLAAPPALAQFVDGGQAFYPDDPLWQDPDRIDGPVPERTSRAYYYDVLLHSFGASTDYDGAALNINTLDEVPNSSWYTNRHYWRPMSIDALQRGPNTVEGPSLREPLRVVAGKQEGAALGVEVVDARGDRYLLKFDPPAHPEMSTGAEVISTKLLYALGYHVPENYLVYFDSDQLVAGESATYETSSGETRELTAAFVDTLLARAHRSPDGRYRALASRFIEGEPVGPFSYFGTRPDDPNDIYPHEARRELRGLRVAAAWLGHYDARMGNTLDMAVTEDGRTFVRHHLIDFGSTLGSGATGEARRWLGHEYVLEGWPVLARTLTLGLAASSWIDVDYPEESAVGHWSDEQFDPTAWKTKYPNPAFERMDADDAFWAAKQIANLSDEALRAVVATARYSSPAAERYVADVLIARRDAVAEAFLHHGGGLDRFHVRADSLTYDDLLVRHQLADERPRRVVRWHVFDNEASRVDSLIARAEAGAKRSAIPESDARFLAAAVTTAGLGTTHVYLRRERSGYAVVGVEREGPQP